MPDISMCTSECINAEVCYRKTAKPDEYQSYVIFGQICNESTDYKYFWGDRKNIVKEIVEEKKEENTTDDKN